MEQEQVALDGRQVQVWPDDQALSTRGDPAIVVARFADQGFDTSGLDAKQAAALVKKEIVRFGAAVKASGAKVD